MARAIIMSNYNIIRQLRCPLPPTHVRDFAHARMLKYPRTYVTSRSHLCAFPLLRVCGVRGVLVNTSVYIINDPRVLTLPQAIDRLVIGGGKHPPQQALRMREVRLMVLVEIRLRLRDLIEVEPVEFLRDLRPAIARTSPNGFRPPTFDTLHHRLCQAFHLVFLRHQRGGGDSPPPVRLLFPVLHPLMPPHARRSFSECVGQ